MSSNWSSIHFQLFVKICSIFKQDSRSIKEFQQFSDNDFKLFKWRKVILGIRIKLLDFEEKTSTIR